MPAKIRMRRCMPLYAGVESTSAMALSMALSEVMLAPEVGCREAQVTLTTQPPMYGANDAGGAPVRSTSPESSGLTVGGRGVGVGVAVGGGVGVSVGAGVGVGVRQRKPAPHRRRRRAGAMPRGAAAGRVRRRRAARGACEQLECGSQSRRNGCGPGGGIHHQPRHQAAQQAAQSERPSEHLRVLTATAGDPGTASIASVSVYRSAARSLGGSGGHSRRARAHSPATLRHL